MAMSKTIRIELIKHGMKLKDLAAKCGWAPPNLGAKLKRDNFTEEELYKIADAFGMELIIQMVPKDANVSNSNIESEGDSEVDE